MRSAPILRAEASRARVIEAAGGGLQMRVSSSGGMGPAEWGTTRVDAIYAASPEAKLGVAFTATYNLQVITVDLHANLSKGLLIIASMVRFPDGRRGEFAREFYRKLERRVAP